MALQELQINKSNALDEYQIVLAQDGDKRAFELLYRRWHPKLLRFAYRLTRDPDAAQDVMQDAAVTIAKNISRLERPSRFSAWAYTIVRRRAADYIAIAVKQRRVKAQAGQNALPEEKLSPDETLSLKQALARLPEEDCLLLKLFYTDGMKGSEIAAGMNLPLGTVKSRLFTARQKLKSTYQINPKGDKNE